MLQEIGKFDKGMLSKGQVSFKESRNMETSRITIDDVTFKIRIGSYLKEKNGVRVPHAIKQIRASKPVDLKFFQNVIGNDI
jgi:ribonuclease BN (tRNA processing enzyme)